MNKIFYNKAINRLVCNKKYLLDKIITKLAKLSPDDANKSWFIFSSGVQSTLHTIVTNEVNIVQDSHIYYAFPKRMVKG